MQDDFPDYVTSVAANTLAEALEWIELEWPDIHAARAADIVAFAADSLETLWINGGPEGDVHAADPAL